MKYWVSIWIMCMMGCSKSAIKTQNTQHSSNDEIPFLKSDQTKLGDPIFLIDSLIFKHSAELALEFGLKDSKLFYKIGDGFFKEYLQPLTISENRTVSYYAQKEGYQDSDISQIQLFKSTNKLAGSNLIVNPPPHDNYPGNGASSLTDLEKGLINFRAYNAWCGFQSKTVEIDIKLKHKQKINEVIISILEDHGSWIFAPENIKVMIDDQLIEEKIFGTPGVHSNSKLTFLRISCKEALGRNMKVIIQNMDVIPEWHPGTGTKPWLFIDEILVE